MSKKIALVFPGQGAQFIGMGKDLYDNFAVAKGTYEEINDALDYNLSNLIFYGEVSELNLTINTQPAIMATSVAAYRVLMQELGVTHASEICSVVAGHSLGEYSALCSVDALTLSDTAKLLKIRGNAMQEAVPVGEGAMSALLGIDIESAKKLVDDTSKYGVCAVANDNSIGQIVISGSYAAIEYAEGIAAEYGCKKAIRLQVSAPFHCALMEPAALIMQDALAQVKISRPAIPVIANYTAKPNNDSKNVADLLVKQIPGMVRWRETIEYMSKEYGIELFIEVGPGKVLSGLIKRILPDITCMHIQSINDIEAILKKIL